jgi:hypothetical protein
LGLSLSYAHTCLGRNIRPIAYLWGFLTA